MFNPISFKTRKSFTPFAVLFLCSSHAWAQQIVVNAAKAGGIYAVGEKIGWHVELKGEGANNISKISYVLRKGALTEIGRGDLELKDNAADLETHLDEPGSILAEFKAAVPEKPAISALAGALVAPEKIEPSAPRPTDFDDFWNAKIAELKAVPANPTLETAESDIGNVDYWKITLDNIRGTKIRGQIARPKTAEKKLPALLIVQWAGVYPLQKNWVTSRAREGWLTLNINAHDLPIDQPADWYKQLSDTTLKNYPAIGNTDRETSYFLRMYLSCYRAVDYLASRDDWDGKTLVVTGASQGGLQALMTGGLHPKVTAVMANVPAGCDHTGPLVGRRGGWPQWNQNSNAPDAAKRMEASRYFDVVNFAGHIHCPTLVATGLIDTTCPAAGVLAAFNQIQAPKQLLVMEKADHKGQNNSQRIFYDTSNAWLKRLVTGKSPLEK